MYIIFFLCFVIIYCFFVLGYNKEERKKYPHIYRFIDRAVIVFVVALTALSYLGYI